MKKVIYTGIIGDYDDLYNPTVITPGWSYVCFTDNETLFAKRKDYIWDIRMVRDSSLSNTKFARKIKILHHAFLFGFDLSIWIDSNIRIISDLNVFVQRFHRMDMTTLVHPDRKCIYEEAMACIRMGKGLRNVIEKQMSLYHQVGYPINNGLIASRILIRPFNSKIEYLMTKWWDQVLKHSQRDQLSFNFVVWETPLDISLIPYNVVKTLFQLRKHKHGNSKHQKYKFDGKKYVKI